MESLCSTATAKMASTHIQVSAVGIHPEARAEHQSPKANACQVALSGQTVAELSG